MKLYTENITSNYRFINEINTLAKKAFPIEEYLAPKELIKMAQEDDFLFLALIDEDVFIGFMAIKIYIDFTYLFFLAIDEEYQSKGYGSKAIELIKEKYPNKKHTVDFEMITKNAKNYEQRLKRRNFYLKNGYKETNLFLSYLGVDYEVFCTDNNFDTEMFKSMMKTINVEGFNPKYFVNKD